ncbi:MAG: hypothetical protein NTY75_03595 [Candidatus Shapirobacteria bacterium]|nr:hypothetical protein [Candidatus Shapirobacteria bacterium]
MLKWLKINPKFFFYGLLVLTCLFTFSIFADEVPLLKQKQDAISQGGNQEAWLNEALKSNVVSGLNSLVGQIPDNIINGQAPPASWIPGGAIGVATRAVAMAFTPPASGIQYVAQTWDNFLGKPAYAQTNTGFAGLQPILPIWRGFRNVVYILASLVFIIIGIMIMLRVKISPQAVITVQNAIPQLITALVLVTFSYAIAGLLIDLMNFVQGAMLSILFTANGKALTADLLSPNLLSRSDYSTLNNLNLITTLTTATKNIPLYAVTAIGAIIGGVLGFFAFAVPVVGELSILGGIGLGAALFTLVVAILLFINILKFFFGLIKVYINVILKIVLAPLEIGLGVFPGSKANFSSWLLELVGNLAVFPVSIFFIVLINYIAELSGGGTLWAPGMINAGNFIGFIIAFGGFLILPKIPEMIPQVFFNLKPSPWGTAATEAFGQMYKPIGSAANQKVHNLAGKAFASNVATGGAQTTNSNAGKFMADVMELLGMARH